MTKRTGLMKGHDMQTNHHMISHCKEDTAQYSDLKNFDKFVGGFGCINLRPGTHHSPNTLCPDTLILITSILTTIITQWLGLRYECFYLQYLWSWNMCKHTQEHSAPAHGFTPWANPTKHFSLPDKLPQNDYWLFKPYELSTLLCHLFSLIICITGKFILEIYKFWVRLSLGAWVPETTLWQGVISHVTWRLPTI